MPRHLAVLERPPIGPPRFTFPVEGSSDDHRSNYWHGQKYGNGGFTGERCLVHRAGPWRDRPVFFRLDDHERRLEATVAAHEYLDVGCTKQQRVDARFRLMAMNQGDTYLSLIFGSEGATGVYPKNHLPAVVITSSDMDPERKPYLPIEAMRRGLTVRLAETDLRRKPPGRVARAKASANYLESNLCKHRALLAGCDDGLMLDYTGEHIAEASVSNLVIHVDDELCTPWAESGPLPGITLQTVGQLAHDLPQLMGRRAGLPLREVPIHVGDLRSIRGAFLTGTAVGVVKIRTIVDAKGEPLWTLRDRESSALIDDLHDCYWNLLYGTYVGYHDEWFTPIPEEVLEEYRRQQSFLSALGS